MLPVGNTTIVIPTFNEADNIRKLFKGLKRHLPIDTSTRLIFVDDSPDDLTVKAIDTLDEQMASPSLKVTVYHRKPEDRNGLAGAVVDGIRRANTKYVGVSDADGQHPADTIPLMLAAIERPDVDIVLASRYCPGGSADGLDNPVRHAVSRLSTLVAKCLFPRELRGVTDPMTGFFMFERQSVNVDSLEQTTGFKILLELLVTHPQLCKAEVPLKFAARNDGVSKGTVTQGWLYLRQLLRLRLTPLHTSIASKEF